MPTANGGPIKGITTPNKHTIVFKLTEPKGQLVADALVLPLTAAVPKEYAEKFDKNKPSDYGNYQVATGPYMLKNNSAGEVLGIGYVPGKSATLVRNPNWNRQDRLPARLPERNPDQDRRQRRGHRPAGAGRHATSSRTTTRSAQSIIRLAAERYKSQLSISPGRRQPLHHRQQQGRAVHQRQPAQGLLGGARPHRDGQGARRGAGDGRDDALHLSDDPRLRTGRRPEGARRSTSTSTPKATWRSPKSTSSWRATRAANTPAATPITIVGATGSPAEQDAEIVNQTLKNLGFTTKFTLVETATMYAKYCNVPKEEIDGLPERRLDRRLRRPADGAQHHVQRQEHRLHGQRQPGPGRHPENQRSDDQGRTGLR